MAGEIISERRARSNRIGGRHHLGFAGDFPRNPHASGPAETEIRRRLRNSDLSIWQSECVIEAAIGHLRLIFRVHEIHAGAHDAGGDR